MCCIEDYWALAYHWTLETWTNILARLLLWLSFAILNLKISTQILTDISSYPKPKIKIVWDEVCWGNPPSFTCMDSLSGSVDVIGWSEKIAFWNLVFLRARGTAGAGVTVTPITIKELQCKQYVHFYIDALLTMFTPKWVGIFLSATSHFIF